jgi:hypothetical protein
MRQIVLVSALLIALMIGAPSVYAETAFQSGFKHGVADANHKDPECAPHQFPCPRPTDYIHQPGKGFAFHTTEFVNGYIKGWCSVMGSGSGIDVNDDEIPPTVVSFDCDKGLSSAYPYATDWCLVMDNSEFPVCH